MSVYFGYLRVSTDGQDVESQKLGLLEYANRHGFAPMELVAETIGRAVDWRSRALAPSASPPPALPEASRGKPHGLRIKGRAKP